MRHKAETKHIQLLPSDPCLEGLLWKILGSASINTSENLKRNLHPKLSGKRQTRPAIKNFSQNQYWMKAAL